MHSCHQRFEGVLQTADGSPEIHIMYFSSILNFVPLGGLVPFGPIPTCECISLGQYLCKCFFTWAGTLCSLIGWACVMPLMVSKHCGRVAPKCSDHEICEDLLLLFGYVFALRWFAIVKHSYFFRTLDGDLVPVWLQKCFCWSDLVISALSGHSCIFYNSVIL